MIRQNNYKIISSKNAVEFVKSSADRFLNFLSQFETPTVILPTGNTPLPMYKALRESGKKLNFTYLQLDEYLGLEPDSQRLFSNWLAQEVLDPMEIPYDQRIIFRSDNLFPQDEVDKMQGWFEENGPADIAVLGIGSNGHIGFNEPPSDENTRTRIVELRPETLKANNAYWQDEKKTPEQVFTLGISEILKSKKIILLVTGKSKAKILKKALTEEPNPNTPASYLQTHPDVTVIADKEALSELKA